MFGWAFISKRACSYALLDIRSVHMISIFQDLVGLNVCFSVDREKVFDDVSVP